MNDVNSTINGVLYEEPCDFINKNPRGENKPVLISRNFEVEFVVVNVIGDGSGELVTPGEPIPNGNAAADEYLVISQEGDECLIDDIEGRLVIIGEEDLDSNQTTLYKFFEEIDEFQTEICGQPSKAPTSDPTTDPTKEPTTDPTRNPTLSPVVPACAYIEEGGYLLDLVILVKSCYNVPKLDTDQQCELAQEKIAEAVISIRGESFGAGDGLPNARISYIEFGSGNNVDIIIPLKDGGIDEVNKNILGINANSKRLSIYNQIRNSDICDDINQQFNYGIRNNSPNLNLAIQKALDEFNSDTISGRDQKIIIFSDCQVDNTEKQDICDDYEDTIRSGGINVIMVNSDVQTPDNDYISCLVEYDGDRIIDTESQDTVEQFETNTIPDIQTNLCEEPSPAPNDSPRIEITASAIFSCANSHC